MRAHVLVLPGLIACGGSPPPQLPMAHGAASGRLATVDWLNREYRFSEEEWASLRFSDGKYADNQVVLQLGAPIYLDVTGDGVEDALLPLQIDEAETAWERGMPRRHTLLVFSMKDGEPTHLGDLPVRTCGPLHARIDGPWLTVTTTRRGAAEDMCGGPAASHRYRWDGGWFLDPDGEELEGRRPPEGDLP